MSEQAPIETPVHEEATVDRRRLLRWSLALLIALLVIGFAAYARGDEHMRGDEVGALAATL